MPPNPPLQKTSHAIPWIGICVLGLLFAWLLYWAFTASNYSKNPPTLPLTEQKITEQNKASETPSRPMLAPKSTPGPAPNGNPGLPPTIKPGALGAAAVLAQADVGISEVKEGDKDEYGNRWDAKLNTWISPEGLIWDSKGEFWKDEDGNHWDDTKGTWVSSDGFLWDVKRETWKDEDGNYWDSKRETWVSPEGLVWDGTNKVWKDEYDNYWDEKLGAWISPDGFRWDGTVWRDSEGNFWDEKRGMLINKAGTMYWVADKEEWALLDDSSTLGAQSDAKASSQEGSIKQKHMQCKNRFDAEVARTVDGFKTDVGSHWGELNGSYGTFFSTSLNECAGVVLIESVDKKLSSYFVFNARTRALVNFDTSEGNTIFSEFVNHFDEI